MLVRPLAMLAGWPGEMRKMAKKVNFPWLPKQSRAEQATRICCPFLCLMGTMGLRGISRGARKLGRIDCCVVPCILPTGAHRAYQYILDSSGLELDYTTWKWQTCTEKLSQVDVCYGNPCAQRHTEGGRGIGRECRRKGCAIIYPNTRIGLAAVEAIIKIGLKRIWQRNNWQSKE